MVSGFDRASCLYHYTSATGLDGILSQRVLRATDTGFLNDWKEVVYVAEPLIPRLSELVGEAVEYDAEHDPLQKTRTRMAESARDAIKRFTRLDDDMPEPNPGQYVDGATYVACLTENHDQLGQWRGYGQTGYSIGFTKGGLEKVSANLQKIAYGDAQRDSICDEILEYLQTRPSRGHPGTHGYYDAVNFCMPRLATVKHDAFKQEEEWRLIVSKYGVGTPAEVRVRPSPRLTPYIELAFETSCVAEIVIGPGGDSNSERAVRAALRSHNFDPNSIQITHSTAPFKG